jgi:hypothetical protein
MVANSYSMARCQFGSARAAQTEEGTGDRVGTKVADSVSLSAGSPTSLAWSLDED